MKMIPKLSKRNYIATVGIFLIAVALIAANAACDGYGLTMTVNPSAGGTTNPPPGTYPVNAPTQVNISAIANPLYDFVIWTAVPPVIFTNPNAPSTDFAMPTQNVTVTAHFVGPLDHFKCYSVESPTPIRENVTLEDQFGAVNATVEYVMAFGNPAEKRTATMGHPIRNPDHHLTVYNITTASEPKTWYVEVEDQFGIRELTVSGPVALAVPTRKLTPGNHSAPVGLDHFLLYNVIYGSSVNLSVPLNDEFGNESEVKVYNPVFFATPVKKTRGEKVTNIRYPERWLVFYEIEAMSFNGTVQVDNQFGKQNLDVFDPLLLAVPSNNVYYKP